MQSTVKRSLFAFILIFLACQCHAGGFTVTWNFSQVPFYGTGGKSNKVDIQPMFAYTSTGTNIIAGAQVTRYWTDTNATLSLTNLLLPGFGYKVTYYTYPDSFFGATNITFTNSFPASLTNNDVVNGADPLYLAVPTNVSGSTVAYSQVASRQLFMTNARPTVSNYVLTATDTNGGYSWQASAGGSPNALTNATASSSPGISVANQVVTIGTNYDALGAATNAQAGATNSLLPNIAAKVGFSNVMVLTTNYGFHVTGTPITAINNNYWLSFTNSGIANAGYAFLTNEADSRFSIVVNDLSNPGYSLESNLVSIYYYATDPLSTWTPNDGPAPAPVVTATNKITTNWVTSFSATNPPAVDSVFPAVAANNTIWVDPNATGTGLRGRKDHPFKDIHDAQLASRAGDMFVLLPGAHQLSFDFMPTNSVIDARGAIINYTTNNGVVNCNPSFFPVGSCTIYGGTWSNAYWSGGTTLGFANVTNFIAYHSRFYAYAFIGSDTSISSNCVAEMNGCFFQGSDYQSFILSGQNTNTYLKWLNCTFQPSSLPGGFFNDYGPSPARQVLALSNMRCDVVNCLFDWSYTTNTLSAASASNSWCIVADTNSFVFANNNSFILSPYKGTNNVNTIGTYWQTNGGVVIQQRDGSIYTNLSAANITGTLPQYPVAKIAVNIPGANQIYATDGNTNRVTTNTLPSGVSVPSAQLSGTIPVPLIPSQLTNMTFYGTASITGVRAIDSPLLVQTAPGAVTYAARILGNGGNGLTVDSNGVVSASAGLNVTGTTYLTNNGTTWTINPTTTNLYIEEVITNSANALETNTFMLGNVKTGNLLKVLTNGVQTVRLARDGTLALGTNETLTLSNNVVSIVNGGVTSSFQGTSTGAVMSASGAASKQIVVATNLVYLNGGTTIDSSGNMTNNFVKASSSGFTAGTATWTQTLFSFADWGASFGWSSGSAWGHDSSGGNPKVIFGSGKPNLIEIGGATASFPALYRTNATLVLVGGDGVSYPTNNLIVSGVIVATNGVASYRTNAWTTADLGTNGMADWNSNATTVVFRSFNSNGVIYNKLLLP